MNFSTILLSLLFIMDPFGDTPFFIALLAPFSPKTQRFIIIRESLIALFVLLLFALFGNRILHLINISTSTIAIAGGIILFVIAFHMLFPTQEVIESENENNIPFIVPIAIPLIAGPGVMSTLIIYSHAVSQKWELVLALFLAWAISTVIYLSLPFIKKIMGHSGINALGKLGGILLIMIATQMISDGIIEAVTHVKTTI